MAHVDEVKGPIGTFLIFRTLPVTNLSSFSKLIKLYFIANRNLTAFKAWCSWQLSEEITVSRSKNQFSKCFPFYDIPSHKSCWCSNLQLLLVLYTTHGHYRFSIMSDTPSLTYCSSSQTSNHFSIIFNISFFILPFDIIRLYQEQDFECWRIQHVWDAGIHHG